jgi:tRNA dimethylallyltransferase
LKNKICIIIVGPTAVGKTYFAVELAKVLNTEIISADSRQCYKELNIGVAKPSPLQLQSVQHHFINSHSIQEEVNAKIFEEYSLQKANLIFDDHDTTVMVGGTGLYIKAFCEGMDELPLIESEIRKEIVSNYNNGGIEWLSNEVKQKDSLFFDKGEMQNPQRMMRALEVILSTGRSIIEFQSHKKKERDFSIIKMGLVLPKEKLHQNIHQRIDDMLNNGLLDEVKNLISFKNLNALQTVGYKELFDHLEGKISLAQASEQIKTNTRQYAKRQMTWFKKDREVDWYNPSDINAVEDIIKKSTNNYC